MASKKTKRAVVAVATAATLLLGGTFAWQSISQMALNEASDVINPGGRLHDDFNGENKDVYVENFAEDPIYARIKLDEYFEIVMNQGTAAEVTDVITTGASKDEKNTWLTHDFSGENTTDAYWSWATGGSTVYMPTFNMNKDSLQADINGTYAGPDGTDGVYEGDTVDRYDDYVDYSLPENASKTADEIYDADSNDVEDENIKTVENTHTAKSTLGATLMSMQEWIDAGSQPGPYWVYDDEDGWVYWAQAIEPGTATGLLLDGIELNQVMDDSWYYAINVTGQFITADDLGRGEGTGFYDTTKGDKVPSADALKLLEKIGVDTTAKVSSEVALRDALQAGGNIEIADAIDVVEMSQENANHTYNIMWDEGGTIEGGSLTLNGGHWGLFINNENNYPKDGDGSEPATMINTTINGNGNAAAVYTQAINDPINLENVTVTGDKIGLYTEFSGMNGDIGTVTLDNCTITSRNTSEKYWQNAAVAVCANTKVDFGAGHVIINSGTYTGDYAAYVYSSGGTIEINGGTFNGKLAQDAGALIIRGGTFTVDPTQWVAEGYEAVDNGDGTWTVQEKAVEVPTLTYSVVEPEGWDGTLSRRESVRVRIEGDYESEDLTFPTRGEGATCLDSVVDNGDGTYTINHVSTVCGGGGDDVTFSLISNPEVFVTVSFTCDY